MNKYRNSLLALTSGILLALSYPPMPLFILAFVGFVPLLFALEQNPKRPYFLVYLTFFIYHAGTNWWVSSWQPECDPFLLVSGLAVDLFHPFFFYVPIIIYRTIQKRINRNTALWCLPFAWVVFEWLHSLGEFSYPWLNIGQTQIYNHYWIQIADIAGVWGASFLVLLVNVLIFKIILNIKEDNSGYNLFKSLVINKQSQNFSILILLLIIIPITYGGIRTSQYSHTALKKENTTLKIGVIQPNINPWLKWENDPIEQIKKHFAIQDSLIKAAGGLDLTVWSETALLYLGPEFNVNHNLTGLRHWMDSSLTPLLSGYADFVVYDSSEKAPPLAKVWNKNNNAHYVSYNSAIMLNFRDSSNPLQIYHKMKLTPFGERMPYAEYLLPLVSFMEWGVGISSWSLGTKQKNLTLYTKGDTVNLAPIICIESIYPGFVRNFTKLGANIMCIITNDGWYDHTTGPEQHFLIAQMRAIENRRYLVRCANTGVSGFITPTGETISRLPEYQAAGLFEEIPDINTQSIYVMFGDWLPVMATVICSILILYSIYKRYFINSV
jgi:apolipoprotein N-acyltransferase